MEGLGILIFIFYVLSKVAEKLGEQNKGGGQRPFEGPWPGAGEPWPKADPDWQWEEDVKDWPEPVTSQGNTQPGVSSTVLVDDHKRTFFNDKRSPIELGREALIREEDEVPEMTKEALVRPTLASNEFLTAQQVLQGIIFAEIIGPPKAKRFSKR